MTAPVNTSGLAVEVQNILSRHLGDQCQCDGLGKASYEIVACLSRLMAEGGLSKEPLGPLGPEVMQLVIDLREYAKEARTSGNDLADVPSRLLFDAAEMLSITEYGYRKVCEKNDELQALCSALQANEVKRLSNPVDDGAVERVTHPEAQGNKDLGEPQTSFAWQKIETAPRDGTTILCTAGYRADGRAWSICGWISFAYWTSKMRGDGEGWHDGAGIHEIYPKYWAPLPPPPSERSEAAPTSPQPIKGESELESASNGMGLR